MTTLPRLAQFIRRTLISAGGLFLLLGMCPACLGGPEGGGREGGKVFLALGICLAAVCLVFYIVAKGREKD